MGWVPLNATKTWTFRAVTGKCGKFGYKRASMGVPTPKMVRSDRREATAHGRGDRPEGRRCAGPGGALGGQNRAGEARARQGAERRSLHQSVNGFAVTVDGRPQPDPARVHESAIRALRPSETRQPGRGCGERRHATTQSLNAANSTALSWACDSP